MFCNRWIVSAVAIVWIVHSNLQNIGIFVHICKRLDVVDWYFICHETPLGIQDDGGGGVLWYLISSCKSSCMNYEFKSSFFFGMSRMNINFTRYYSKKHELCMQTLILSCTFRSLFIWLFIHICVSIWTKRLNINFIRYFISRKKTIPTFIRGEKFKMDLRLSFCTGIFQFYGCTIFIFRGINLGLACRMTLKISRQFFYVQF